MLIRPDSIITFSEDQKEIRLDGVIYLKKSREFNPFVTKNLANLVQLYKEKAIRTNCSIQIDLSNCMMFLKELATFSAIETPITHTVISKRFSFLENHAYFYRSFETTDACVYQFTEPCASLGEVQYIYISIPKQANNQVHSNFKTIQDGNVRRLDLKKRPRWFATLYNQAKAELNQMYKLRRLFVHATTT